MFARSRCSLIDRHSQDYIQSNTPGYHEVVRSSMESFFPQPVKSDGMRHFVTPKVTRPRQENVSIHSSRASSLTEPDLPTAHVTPRPSLTPSPYLPRGGSAHRDLRQPWSDRVPTAAASYDHHRQQAAPRDTSTVVTTADVMLARQDVARHGYLGYPGGAGYAYGRPQGYREADLSGAMGGDDCFDSMLSHWQQRHRDELRRQQLDVSQPMLSGAVSQQLSVYEPTDRALALNDPHKLDAIKRAADNIIKEKDTIIDKQRIRLMVLEQQTKASDDAMYRPSFQKMSEEAENLAIQLQDSGFESGKEAKYENASLKVVLSNKGASFGQLQKKLGQTEYEMRQFQIAKEKQTSQHEEERRELEERLSAQKTELAGREERYEALRRERDDARRKTEGLERYLADMPTPSAQTKRLGELKSLREDRAVVSQRLADLERKLADGSRAISSRDALIETLEAAESQQKQRSAQLQKELDQLRLTLSNRDESTEPTVDLLAENSKLKVDRENARKLLRSLQRRLEQSERRQTDGAARGGDRLANEQAAVTALRDELANRDQQLKALIHSVKKAGRENEELLSAGVEARDRLQALEQAASAAGDLPRLQRRLHADMAACHAELRALVELCTQCAQGRDLNVSALLGVRGSSAEPEAPSGGDLEECLRGRLTQMTELRQQVDGLRELLCSRYAEDMGDNLNSYCTTQ